MATGGVPGSKDEDFRYTCTLCMESYRGRSPKILPCFHTFCLPCLSALEASVTTAAAEASRSEDETKDATEDGGEDADGEGKGAGEEEESKAENVSVEGSARQGQGESGKIFLCPTCRASVTIPEGGVINLQTNVYIDHEASCEETSLPALCDMCEEGSQQHATFSCRECQLSLCRACRRGHDMIARDHHVTSIISLSQPMKGKKREDVEEEKEEDEGEKKPLCMVHRDQVLCFHCQQCHVSICLHCKFSSHEGHDTVELSRAILQAKGEMTSLVTSAQQQIHTMEALSRSMERKERQLTRHVQETTQKVHARFDQLLTWGQQSRDRLLDAVSRKEDEDKSHLQAEKSAFTFAIEKLSCLLSRATSQSSGRDPDVVELRNELKAALISEDKLERHRHQSESYDAPWPWRYDHHDASYGLQEVDINAFIGGLVEGRADDDDDVTQRVSLQHLAAKLDRFMSDTTSKEADLEEKIASLNEDSKNGETARRQMSQSVTDLMKSRDDLQKTSAYLSGDIQALKVKDADLEKKIASLNEDIKNGETARQQMTQTVVETKTDLMKYRDDLQRTSASLSDDIQALKVKDDEFVKNVTSLEQEVQSLQMSDADILEAMTSLREKTGKVVSFYAQDVDTTKTQCYHPLVFSDLCCNHGEGFDISTGKFTAAVPGSYTFTATVGSNREEKHACAYLCVNITEYAPLRGSYDSMGAVSVCLRLKAGDTVWVKPYSQHDLFSETTFTGALIRADM